MMTKYYDTTVLIQLPLDKMAPISQMHFHEWKVLYFD